MQPFPETKTVCSVCGLDWYEHTQGALADALSAHYAAVDGPFDFENTDIQVTLDQCIPLLKAANRGPMGPPGMTIEKDIPCAHDETKEK